MSTLATPDDGATVKPTTEEETTATDTRNEEADKARAEELKNQANECFKSKYMSIRERGSFPNNFASVGVLSHGEERVS